MKHERAQYLALRAAWGEPSWQTVRWKERRKDSRTELAAIDERNSTIRNLEFCFFIEFIEWLKYVGLYGSAACRLHLAEFVRLAARFSKIQPQRSSTLDPAGESLETLTGTGILKSIAVSSGVARNPTLELAAVAQFGVQPSSDER
ncbi:hypothetical protein B0H19DRAFT_1069939 [Mycena capillaripes]|nr:hypothetical protein B0H19DRAFT_1069939 [Mycena capillaripes]